MNFRSIARRVTLFVVLIGIGSFGSARADVVYEYSGNNFTSLSSLYMSGDSITGSLAFASPLGDSLNLASVNPTSFSFSDGVQTISNTSTLAFTPQFLISSNVSGDIIGWSIIVNEWTSSGLLGDITTTSLGGGDTAGFIANAGLAPSITGQAYSYTPGVWVGSPVSPVATTPLPPSWTMMLIGLAGFGFSAYRRKSKPVLMTT
jgi:hypothetical protein